MPRGPRKKLAALDHLDGNPSNRLIVESGIEALGEPFVPEHLMDNARGAIEVIKQSMPEKVYSALDSFLLAAYGMAWAVHVKASHMINAPDFDWIVTNSQGTETQSPWLKILNQQSVILASLGDRLGLDPKSRMGMKLPGSKQNETKSRFAGLLGRTEQKRLLGSSKN